MECHTPVRIPHPTNLHVVKSHLADVWRVSTLSAPWNHHKGSSEQQKIVSAIIGQASYRAIWTRSLHAENGDGWLFSDFRTNFDVEGEGLKEGEWAAFFSRHAFVPSVVKVVVPTYPSSAEGALKSVQDLNACCAIWSWYDDTEWLIAGVEITSSAT